MTKGEVSNWIVAAMAIGLVALVILGVHPPASLDRTSWIERRPN